MFSSSREQTDEYWLGELRSLGISPRSKSEPNNAKELRDLTDNIKQTMYQDYKSAYSREREESEEEI